MFRLATAFLQAPTVTGTITGSSRRLARAIADHAFREGPRVVLEVGAGDGAITRELARRARATGATVLALDVNRALLAANDAAAGRAVADASRAPVRRADVVVSSIPFGVLPEPAAERILRELSRLSDRVVLYQYTRRRFTALARHFPDIGVVDRVLFNVPPAYVLASA